MWRLMKSTVRPVFIVTAFVFVVLVLAISVTLSHDERLRRKSEGTFVSRELNSVISQLKNANKSGGETQNDKGEMSLKLFQQASDMIASSSENAKVGVLFTIRTLGKYHKERMPVLLDTWVKKTNPSQVRVFTENPNDKGLAESLRARGIKMYSTAHCQAPYVRRLEAQLCCKSGAEHKLYTSEETKHFRWFCHVDDDMYINTKMLYKELSPYAPLSQKIYYGRKAGQHLPKTSTLFEKGNVALNSTFKLMYGGFYCLSRKLVEETKPYFGGSLAYMRTCKDGGHHDDTLLGAVITFLVRDAKMVFSSRVNHHVNRDPLNAIPLAELKYSVTISYGHGRARNFQGAPNVVNITNARFDIKEDPTRFKSFHCFLNPEDAVCH